MVACRAIWVWTCIWVFTFPGPGTAQEETDGTCLLQESAIRKELVWQDTDLGTFATEEEPALSEVRRPLCLFFLLCAGYTAYCIAHAVLPLMEKDDRLCAGAADWQGGAAAAALAPQTSTKPDCGRDAMLDCHLIRFVTTYIMVARHLADVLDYTNPLRDELHSWGNAFVIPAFSFASGVFNASADSRAVFQVWSCATVACLLSLIAHVVIAISLSFGPVNMGLVFLHRLRYYWYLPCLFLWRATVLPLASITRAWQVPTMVTFSFVFSVCYLGRHFWLYAYDGPSTPVFIWNRIFAFGPFFAAGALLPRRTWLRLMGDLRLQAIGALYFAVWHLLLLAFPDFRHWNVTACFEPGVCEFHSMGGHFPMAALYRPYSFTGVLMDLAIYAAMLPITLSVIWLVGGVLAFVTSRAPRLLGFCASCGAYTLFALVLHVPLVELAKLAHVRLVAQKVPEPLQGVLLALLALHLVLVLTSGATVALLRAVAAPLLRQIPAAPAPSGACEQPEEDSK
mmetsp:Transcript_111883/g.311414  ORF Transcript_111883/g.311414 Transcript_111883/m.311414 type:complete len:510 (+) Transcript_111883:82-1611(+)